MSVMVFSYTKTAPKAGTNKAAKARPKKAAAPKKDLKKELEEKFETESFKE